MNLLQKDIQNVLDDVKYVQAEYAGIRDIKEDRRNLWDGLKDTIGAMRLTYLHNQFKHAFEDLIEWIGDRDERIKYLHHFRTTLETLLRCTEYVPPVREEEELDRLMLKNEILHSLDISSGTSNIPLLESRVYGERAGTLTQIQDLFQRREICGMLVRYHEKIVGYALFDPDNASEVTTIHDIAAEDEPSMELLLCNILSRVSSNNGAQFPRHKRLKECVEQWHNALIAMEAGPREEQQFFL